MDRESSGTAAARLLLDKIGGKKHAPERILLPTELRIRESVAAPNIVHRTNGNDSRGKGRKSLEIRLAFVRNNCVPKIELIAHRTLQEKALDS